MATRFVLLNVIAAIKNVVIGGGAKLILGDLEFKSEEKYNRDI
jgi:hypothetical protein